MVDTYPFRLTPSLYEYLPGIKHSEVDIPLDAQNYNPLRIINLGLAFKSVI
jgi:hypothetical protein